MLMFAKIFCENLPKRLKPDLKRLNDARKACVDNSRSVIGVGERKAEAKEWNCLCCSDVKKRKIGWKRGRGRRDKPF
jgi:hypothetical protein